MMIIAGTTCHSDWFARLSTLGIQHSTHDPTVCHEAASIERFSSPPHPPSLSSTNKAFYYYLPFIVYAHPMASSSSNFQLILNNALDEYKKRTKKDLLAHPLFFELQSCNSSSTILAALQQQLQGLEQSRRSDDRWTRWLDPTVNVLFTLSATLGEGVGLVCVRT